MNGNASAICLANRASRRLLAAACRWNVGLTDPARNEKHIILFIVDKRKTREVEKLLQAVLTFI